jgi:hypothetical protein
MWNDVVLAYCGILLQLALEKIRKATKIIFFHLPSFVHGSFLYFSKSQRFP